MGKYPPLQGGVSCGTYWLARALAQKGHKIFIVTNTQEAGFEYSAQIYPRDSYNLEPDNITLINTRPLNSRFIPAYPAFVSKLAGLSIEAIKKEKIDVLYSNYLLPYGVAASIAQAATGIPWFLDHAGSDITNLLNEEQLRPVFLELFKQADVVVNSPQVRYLSGGRGFIGKEKLAPLSTDKLFARSLDDVFSPQVKPAALSEYFQGFRKELPVFTCPGKVSFLHKTFAFIEAASKLPKGRFYLLFITEQGRNQVLLKNKLRECGLTDQACVLPFVPPWKVPSFFNASTCVVCPEDEEDPDFPQGTHSSRLPLEAMMCGKCVIVGKGMSKKFFYSSCQDGKHLLAVNPRDTREFSRILRTVIEDPGIAEKIGRQARGYILKQKVLFENAVNGFIENLHYTLSKR